MKDSFISYITAIISFVFMVELMYSILGPIFKFIIFIGVFVLMYDVFIILHFSLILPYLEDYSEWLSKEIYWIIKNIYKFYFKSKF